MEKPNKTFDLEHQYRLYLERMNLRETDMHSVQRLQLKQTFYEATRQMLMLLRDDVAALDEREAAAVYDDLVKQVFKFFQTQN